VAEQLTTGKTYPILGVFGVLLGAMIASFAGRLLSVGLADLRPGIGFSVDQAAWIGTAFNAGLMFIGPFSVYIGGLLGPRRVLLFCAIAFTVISAILPFCLNPVLFFVMVVLLGLTGGTFYPLTLSFILRNIPIRFVLLAIAAYAMDIVFTTYFATSVEAWYLAHLSWRWIFWNSVILTPIMFVLVKYGIQKQPLPQPKEGQPKPSWRGFLYASLGFSFLYIALDQGQRLNWMESGLIVACVASGSLLLIATVVRRFTMPNPLVHLGFLRQWNIVLLGGVLVCFRFVMLAAVVVVPNYLGTVQSYRPDQTGATLLWVALPQFAFGLLAMALLQYVDARIIVALGFLVTGLACVLNSTVTSVWSGDNLILSQAILSFGFAFAFNGMVGAIILQAVNSGALAQPIDALTFGGYFQTLRLFGGEVGTAIVLHFISAREQFHSNRLVPYINAGNPLAVQRLSRLRAGMQLHTGASTALARGAELLALQVRRQAFTLAVADTFQLVAWAAFLALLIVACMKRVPTQYRQLINPQKRPS
jgi:DHA2 family multidrug resistance protein